MKVKRALLFVTIALFLTGCSSNNEKEEVISQESYSYVPEYQVISTDHVPYRAVIGESGNIFFAVYEEMVGSSLFCWSYGETVPRQISLQQENGKWITAMGRDTDDNILLAYGLYEEELKQLELMKISQEGKLVDSIDVTDIFKNKEGMEGFEAEHLIGDHNGNYYIGSTE